VVKFRLASFSCVQKHHLCQSSAPFMTRHCASNNTLVRGKKALLLSVTECWKCPNPPLNPPDPEQRPSSLPGPLGLRPFLLGHTFNKLGSACARAAKRQNITTAVTTNNRLLSYMLYLLNMTTTSKVQAPWLPPSGACCTISLSAHVRHVLNQRRNTHGLFVMFSLIAWCQFQLKWSTFWFQ